MKNLCGATFRNRLCLWLVVTLVATCATGQTPQPRLSQSLDGIWKFQFGERDGDTTESFDDSQFENVTVPHSWPQEGQSLPAGGFRARANYRKVFQIPDAWRGRRIVLRFDAVSLTADVTLNGHHIGEHKGGFAAFNFDITDAVRFGKPNVLAVHVSNEADPDLSPLAGDFTIYGGIYRSVSVQALDPIHINPFDYASSGVFVTQKELDTEHARIEVRAEIGSASASPSQVTLVETVLDAREHPVVIQRASLEIPPKTMVTHVETIPVSHPHLWNGIADPYLYTVRVDVLRNGHLLDRVVQIFGLRSESVDSTRGFILNGKAMQIHGVCLHQEGATRGWAVTREDERHDMQLIRDMGANGIRLAHYQHSQSFLDLADRTGMLIWAELAQVDRVSPGAEYRENIRQQLTELIRQNYNHPSVFVWSLYNELNSPTKDAAIPLVAELNQLAHKEDATRPTSGAGSADTMEHLHAMVAGVDLIAVNDYPGWYFGQPQDMGDRVEQWNDSYGKRGLGVTEYGAGASVHQHMVDVSKDDVQIRGHFHPEEWQASVHEGNYAAIRKKPFVWGAFVWNMFDFSSAARHEGDTEGMNDKGLVSRDRSVKKDAYFFYQANWTSIPMAHIVGCGTTTSRSHTVQMKAYTNTGSLLLNVNGRSYGSQIASETHVLLWPNVELSAGANQVSVIGARGLQEHCTITLEPMQRPKDGTEPHTGNDHKDRP